MPKEDDGRKKRETHFLLQLSRGQLASDRYFLICLLILATILSTAVVGDGVYGIVTLILMTITLNATLATSDAPRRARLVGAIASVATCIAVLAGLLTQNYEPAKLAYAFAMLALALVTPVVIARRLSQHTTVTLSTLTGAASIYLLIGLFFSVSYNLIGMLQALLTGGGPATVFFIASRPLGPSDFTYYSFVTMTTVGYGDIIASTPIGRMISICEALIGQLYLVTVLAVLVANMGRGRRPMADTLAEQLAEED